MKVKALCNILYDGAIHAAGEVFEVKEALKNTEQVIDKAPNKPVESEKAETASAEKPTKRR